MRSFLNNQSIDCTAGRLSISSAPVLCGGNVGCIPRKLFIWIGFCRLPLCFSVQSPKTQIKFLLFTLNSSTVCLSHHCRYFSTWKSFSNFMLNRIYFLCRQILFFCDLYHFCFRSDLRMHRKCHLFTFIYLFSMENMCRTRLHM